LPALRVRPLSREATAAGGRFDLSFRSRLSARQDISGSVDAKNIA
jgi:hypothetical protein